MQDREKFDLVTGFRELSRISYCSGQPSRLLITGVARDETKKVADEPVNRTILYDLAEREVVGEVRIEGQPVYKPALCEGLVAFARQGWEGGEGWRLDFHRQPELVATPIEVHREKAKEIEEEAVSDFKP